MIDLEGLRRDASIGWRNLGRNPRRTALAWAAIAIAQLTMVWVACFMKGYTGAIFNALTGPALGHIQVHARKWRDDGDMGRTIRSAARTAERISGVAGVVRVASRVWGPVLATRGRLGHVATVCGIDVAVEQAQGGMLAGIDPGKMPRPGEVVIGQGLAREMGARSGDEIALMGQAADGSVASGLFRVRAIVVTSLDQINQGGIVMGLRDAQEVFAMPDEVHEFVIRCREAASVPAVAAAVRALPATRGLEVLTWRELAPQIASLLGMSDEMTLVILVLVFITTVAGVANTMLMATFERIHEFGMLLALGLKRARLVRMLLIESLVLGLAGALIGSALGALLAWPGISRGIDLTALTGAGGTGFALEGLSFTRFHLVPDVRGVVVGVLAVMVTSVIAAVLPARRISKMNPAAALRS